MTFSDKWCFSCRWCFSCNWRFSGKMALFPFLFFGEKEGSQREPLSITPHVSVGLWKHMRNGVPEARALKNYA